MTHEEFISLVRQPESVSAEHVTDLKELVERYPYFIPARMLLVKALQQSHSIHYGANVKLAALYSYSRRWLYYYLHPEKMLSTELYRRDRIGKSSGAYFDIMGVVEREGGDTKQSLKNLAERLKSARTMVTTPVTEPAEKNTIITKRDEEIILSKEEPVSVLNLEVLPAVQIVVPVEYVENDETRYKKLIKQKKYREAIEILKKLNLNNPKKSVYFADQIRFLEKILANLKK